MFHIYNKFLVFLVLTVAVQRTLSADTEDLDENIELTTDVNLNYCDSTEHNRTCCYHHEFRCGSGECIKMWLVCNGDSKIGRGRNKYDINSMECNDGSDEYGCSEISCDARKDKCDHTCTDYPTRNMSRCSCYKGYRLSVRNKCQDIDECEIGVHSCSQGCKNLNGTFSCTCNNGFTKSESETSSSSRSPKPTAKYCQPQDENILVMLNYRSWIYFFNMKTKQFFPFVRSGVVDSIDYDPLQDIIYWANGTTMCRSYIPGAKDGYVTVGHTQTLKTPQFENTNERRLFSLDWTTNNIYWVKTNLLDDTKSDIVVSEINSSRIMTIIHKYSPITSLVVDPPSGYIFWTSLFGEKSVFGKSSPFFPNTYTLPLNLSNQDFRSPVVEHLNDGRVCWIDYNTQTIYCKHKWFYSATETVYTTTKEKAPVSIDIFNGDIYWLANETNHIMKIDKFGRGKKQFLLGLAQKPTSNVFKIYHSSKYDKKINYGGLPCQNSTNFCFYNVVFDKLLYNCPDGVEKLTHNSCNISEESLPDDPLDCNCDDLIKICDPQSLYKDCDCHQQTLCSNTSNTNHQLELNSISKTTLVIIILFIIIMTLLFVLSCFKKSV